MLNVLVFYLFCVYCICVVVVMDNYVLFLVISRLGFRFEGIARQAERVNGRWLDHAVWALLATDSRTR